MKEIRILIDTLKQEYEADAFAFMFKLSGRIGGKHQKRLRQQILTELTGEELPASKCTLELVSNHIKASKEQLTLF